MDQLHITLQLGLTKLFDSEADYYEMTTAGSSLATLSASTSSLIPLYLSAFVHTVELDMVEPPAVAQQANKKYRTFRFQFVK